MVLKYFTYQGTRLNYPVRLNNPPVTKRRLDHLGDVFRPTQVTQWETTVFSRKSGTHSTYMSFPFSSYLGVQPSQNHWTQPQIINKYLPTYLLIYLPAYLYLFRLSLLSSYLPPTYLFSHLILFQ